MIYVIQNPRVSAGIFDGVADEDRTRDNRTTTCCVTTTPRPPYSILPADRIAFLRFWQDNVR